MWTSANKSGARCPCRANHFACFRALSLIYSRHKGKILFIARYFFLPQRYKEKNQHYSATENNLLCNVKKIRAVLRFAEEPKGWCNLLHIIPNSKIRYWAKNLIYGQEKFTNYMTKSWKSKDNTIYTPPAALGIYYIHAASPWFSWESLIYTIMSSAKRGKINGTSSRSNTLAYAVFQLNRKGTALCLSPLLFYYCPANGNTSNKCFTRAINIKVDLSIWEKWEQYCSLLAQIWHW